MGKIALKDAKPLSALANIQDLGQDCAKILVEQQGQRLEYNSAARGDEKQKQGSQGEFILARVFLLLFLRKKK